MIQEVIENMPYHEWDSATIDDAIEQYKFGHGRYPKPRNFVYDKKLSNASTVLYRTGIPLKDYLKRFYTKLTNSVKYFDKTKGETVFSV